LGAGFLDCSKELFLCDGAFIKLFLRSRGIREPHWLLVFSLATIVYMSEEAFMWKDM